MIPQDISGIISSFDGISLGEMDNIRLMNRTDTKYIMPVTMVPDLLLMLNADFSSLEIKENRILPYNSGYLDTCNFLFYNQHLTGRRERIKIRFRNYELTGETFLEIKRRTNKGRTSKCRIEINHSDEKSPREIADEFIRQHTSVDPVLLEQVLGSRFRRITLAGKSMPERLTIDLCLSFSDSAMNSIKIPHIAVVELKREGFTSNSPAADILKKMSIHPCGFSKYCVGVSLLYNLPRKNIIKPKLLLLNKIENEYFRDLRA
jgi:hypothetical protein